MFLLKVDNHHPYCTSPQKTAVFFFVGWCQTESTPYVATNWPTAPAPDDRWVWSIWWNENCQGKPKYYEETWASATFLTTNPTWFHLRSEPGRRGGKPATNRLSYGTAQTAVLIRWLFEE
jgi:hypothetical protein